ncbi:hypothetical protein CRE_19277 [Caenorhabditis remanei]|uniref:Uncharacterized protein n=1 Tax=Caenorhabditis remanei TaxID=31234 RepID=E3MJU1_CAERE|nr:hypothetical protein CRE_19277 [Caenorhabditis remanei]
MFKIIPFLGISIIVFFFISSPRGFKPASTEENLSPDKYRLLQRHARSVYGTDDRIDGISIIISLISNPGGFKPASTEVNLSPDKYRLLQRHARSV